jgi:hypothetical protein
MDFVQYFDSYQQDKAKTHEWREITPFDAISDLKCSVCDTIAFCDHKMRLRAKNDLFGITNSKPTKYYHMVGNSRLLTCGEILMRSVLE